MSAVIETRKICATWLVQSVACPGFFFGGGGGYARNFFGGGGSTNSVEHRGQRERGYGGGSPLVRGSTQFANE
jgi:hypothetical protein